MPTSGRRRTRSTPNANTPDDTGSSSVGGRRSTRRKLDSIVSTPEPVVKPVGRASRRTKDSTAIASPEASVKTAGRRTRSTPDVISSSGSRPKGRRRISNDNDTDTEANATTETNSDADEPDTSADVVTSSSKPRNRREINEADDSEGELLDIHPHTHTMNFSQMEPEYSTAPPPPKPTEWSTFENLNEAMREKAVKSLSRLILFKCMNSGMFIERKKCIDEISPEFAVSLGGSGKDGNGDAKAAATKLLKFSRVLFSEAEKRIKATFGFELASVPSFYEGTLPEKYKERYYVINKVHDVDGTHGKIIHGSKPEFSERKGLLMVILAFCFCKGVPKTDGKGGKNAASPSGIRWISAENLYRLLNSVDDRIAEDPPPTQKKNARRSMTAARNRDTLDVDGILQSFVQMDYLLKDKVSETGSSAHAASGGSEDGTYICYAMGPRAALEIGRKQLIYFCAEVLDEQADPTMLAEIDDSLLEESLTL